MDDTFLMDGTMSEPTPLDQYAVMSHNAQRPVSVTYVDDAPDTRQWLMDLRRDLLRKVKQIDEILAASAYPLDH